tara:strand:+ start:379 stop:540 length:162 start_codon:yes stop_codon:yes gene_type:complete
MNTVEIKHMLWEFEEYKTKMVNLYPIRPRPMSILIDGFILEQIKNYITDDEQK